MVQLAEVLCKLVQTVKVWPIKFLEAEKELMAEKDMEKLMTILEEMYDVWETVHALSDGGSPKDIENLWTTHSADLSTFLKSFDQDLLKKTKKLLTKLRAEEKTACSSSSLDMGTTTTSSMIAPFLPESVAVSGSSLLCDAITKHSQLGVSAQKRLTKSSTITLRTDGPSTMEKSDAPPNADFWLKVDLYDPTKIPLDCPGDQVWKHAQAKLSFYGTKTQHGPHLALVNHLIRTCQDSILKQQQANKVREREEKEAPPKKKSKASPKELDL